MRNALKMMSLCLVVAACSQEVSGDQDAGTDGGVALQVAVTYQGTQYPVTLGGLATVDVGGSARVQLSTIVLAALPSKSLGSLKADDYFAGDGFHAASSSKCTPVLPTPGDLLVKGYVDPATRNLTWATDLAYPGCMAPKDLAEVRVSDK